MIHLLALPDPTQLRGALSSSTMAGKPFWRASSNAVWPPRFFASRSQAGNLSRALTGSGDIGQQVVPAGHVMK